MKTGERMYELVVHEPASERAGGLIALDGIGCREGQDECRDRRDGERRNASGGARLRMPA